MAVSELALAAANGSVNILGEISSAPTSLFNPLITNLNEFLQTVQYFGTALIIIYILFMFLRYVESRRVRTSLQDLDKKISSIQKDISKIKESKKL